MTVFVRQQPLAVAAIPARGPLARPWVRDLFVIAAAVALLSVLAQISFEVPFSRDRTGQVVPITGQTFGVLLIGASLGWRRGLSAVVAYLALGFMGAPVFADGVSGYALFTGATAGYLWGFLLAVVAVGWLAEHGFDRGPWLGAVLVLGDALIFATGLPVLALWLDRHAVSLSVWDVGLWPFVAGDLAKIVAATMLVPAAWSLVDRIAPRDR